MEAATANIESHAWVLIPETYTLSLDDGCTGKRTRWSADTGEDGQVDLGQPELAAATAAASEEEGGRVD